MESESNFDGSEVEKFEANRDMYYQKGKDYWESAPPTVDGVLQGFEQVSKADIGGSRFFLKSFLDENLISTQRALDCGAGIGRITKNLLVPVFEKVDVVEQSRSFCDNVASHVDSPNLGGIFCQGLQSFTPEEGAYDLIWIQWVVGHLIDADLLDFLKRCRKGLRPGGKSMMIMKENVTPTGNFFDVDELDGSLSRPESKFVELITQASFEIVKIEKQINFPKELYAVKMFACRPV